MCYIMAVKQLDTPNETSAGRLRSILHDKADGNDHGFYFEAGNARIRTMDEEEAFAIAKDIELNNLLTHFRMATTGEKTVDNVHGWNRDGWKFMHNGTVRGFSGVNQKMSDSYLFFAALLTELNKINKKKNETKQEKQVEHAIRKLSTDHEFYGRALLYNIAQDKMYVFGDFEVYVLENHYLIFSSAILRLDEDGEKDIHGIKVKTSKSVGHYTTAGINVVTHWSRPTFQFKHLGLLKDYTVHHVKTPEQQGRLPIPVAPANQQTGDSYTDDQGNYCRKPVAPGLPEIYLPEQVEMQSNITRARQLDEDDLELNIQTPEDIFELMKEDEENTDIQIRLQLLQDLFGHIGWDKKGNVMIMDDEGIHDIYQTCCQNDKCKDIFDLSGIRIRSMHDDIGTETSEISKLMLMKMAKLKEIGFQLRQGK